MKPFLYTIFSFFLLAHSLNSQTILSPVSFNGGEMLFSPPTQCLSAAERIEIEKNIFANRQILIREGIILSTPDRSSVVLFEWPVIKDPAATGYNNIWAISNFVDQVPGSGIGDWNCGQRTYDGHLGIDIILWPFPWFAYEQEYALAVAAAPGIIIFKQDGNEDDHCSCSCCWNAVFVEHADGSVAFYGHLKLGSLTPKNIGETVDAGEYLGAIASSGCSNIPHLHFEVYEDMPYTNEHLIEPFSGPCNTFNTQSWWADQMPYREPTINAVFTHYAVPVQGCPDINEHPNFENVFIPGELVYTVFYYKDQLAGTTATYQLLRPDNTVYNTWSQTFSNTLNASWWSFNWSLPSTGPFGTWTVSAIYEGETVSHAFQYLEVPPQSGKVGINTAAPQAELHLHSGALYIDDASKGVILKGLNGNCYRLTINASGALVPELLSGCPD